MVRPWRDQSLMWEQLICSLTVFWCSAGVLKVDNRDGSIEFWAPQVDPLVTTSLMFSCYLTFDLNKLWHDDGMGLTWNSGSYSCDQLVCSCVQHSTNLKEDETWECNWRRLVGPYWWGGWPVIPMAEANCHKHVQDVYLTAKYLPLRLGYSVYAVDSE